MRRLLVFVLMFPAIAMLLLDAFSFDDTVTAGMLPGMIVRGYLVGITPALAIALVDWLLRRTSLSRVLLTAVSGYVLASGAGLLMRDVSVVEALQLGLAGAIPAAVCSGLSQSPYRAPNACQAGEAEHTRRQSS
ncbi:hypothetical protein [Bradyrhizobium sp. USDA 4486]